MAKNLSIARLILLFALLTLLGGCQQDTVKIAAVLPLSGDDQAYGQAVRKGVEVAYEELTAADEEVMQLEIVDTESSPEKGKELLKQQYESGALLAVGGVTSGEAKQMIEVIDRYDRVLLSPSASSPELTGISRNFYRVWPSDFSAANKMAQFVSQNLEIKTVVVIAEEQPYAKGIQEVFRSAFESPEYGGEVLEVLEVPPYTTDFSGFIDRVMTLAPDAVYIAAYEAGIGAIIQELRRKDYGGKILTTSAFALPESIARVGKDAVGVFLTQSVFEPDSDFAHVQKFVNAYREKYGEMPNIYAAHGYDAMKVVATALEGRPPIPNEVLKGLREIREFPGVTGSIQFDEKGDVGKFPRIYIIGEDQALYDYNERVRQSQDELRRKREELKKKLQEIQRRAKQIG